MYRFLFGLVLLLVPSLVFGMSFNYSSATEVHGNMYRFTGMVGSSNPFGYVTAGMDGFQIGQTYCENSMGCTFDYYVEACSGDHDFYAIGYDGEQVNGPIQTVTFHTQPYIYPVGPTGTVRGFYRVSGSAVLEHVNAPLQGKVIIGSPGSYDTVFECDEPGSCQFSFDGWLPHGQHTVTASVVGGCNETAEESFSFFSDQTPSTPSVNGPSTSSVGNEFMITGNVSFAPSPGCGYGGTTFGYVDVSMDNQGITTFACDSNPCFVNVPYGASVGEHTVTMSAAPCGAGVISGTGSHSFMVEEYKQNASPKCKNADISGTNANATCSPLPGTDSGYNLITGALTQDIPLFSTGNGPLSTDFRLLYDSGEQLFFYNGNGGNKPYKLPLSQGWTHSYDVSLYTNPVSGQMVLKGAGLPKLFYTPSNGAFISEPGESSVLVRNANGSYTLTFRDGFHYEFDNAGLLTSIVDRYSNAVNLDRSIWRQVKITDPQGRQTILYYDYPNEKIVSITDPSGNVYDLEYNIYVNNMLTTVRFPAVNGVRPTWAFQYTTSDRLLKQKTNLNGEVTSYSYDGNRKLQNTTDPNLAVRNMVVGEEKTTITEKDGGVWEFGINKDAGLLNTKKLPTNQTVYYAYDVNNRVASIQSPISDTTDRIGFYAYDTYGNMTSYKEGAVISGVVQPVDLEKTLTYDTANFDRLLSVSELPSGETTTYVYDMDGGYLRTRVTNPLGAVTSLHQNANGTVRDVAYPGGASLSYTYTVAGYVSTVVDNHNIKTEFSNFTTSGQPQTVKVYDSGNVLRMTTTLTYDVAGRVATSTVAGSYLTTFGYDYMGNQLSVQDANGNTTSQTVNYKGQPVAITNALGKVTTTGYTATHHPASITDANGNITSFTYNQIGQLTKETPPVGVAVRYTYTTAGLIR